MNRTEISNEKKTIQRLRSSLIIVATFACAILLFFVGLDAYTSKVNYEINQLNNQIAETEKELTNLEVKIKSASNITNIEKKALELGMVYPDIDQVIYINGDTEIQEFASALIESVYR